MTFLRVGALHPNGGQEVHAFTTGCLPPAACLAAKREGGGGGAGLLGQLGLPAPGSGQAGAPQHPYVYVPCLRPRPRPRPCAAKAAPQGNGDLEEAGNGAPPRSALSFKPLSLAFHDVEYSVPLPKVRGCEAGLAASTFGCSCAPFK